MQLVYLVSFNTLAINADSSFQGLKHLQSTKIKGIPHD